MDQKLKTSIAEFEDAWGRASENSKDTVLADAVAKRFEVALEYAWKACKRTVNDAGIEAYSPKDVIRESAKIDLIDDPELWIAFINARNLSVHDYLGMESDEYRKLMKPFLSQAKLLLKKLKK